VKASFLGVGAPEAFVIAVVSLLVFGPKGLAEVCPSLFLLPEGIAPASLPGWTRN